MNYLLEALCFCAVMSQPHPQVSRAAGDIWYTHERLSHGKHLLRLSTTDFIIDWDRARKDRLHVFAEEFADGTCQGRYPLTAVAPERRGSPAAASCPPGSRCVADTPPKNMECRW